jgi:hypothetical protein
VVPISPSLSISYPGPKAAIPIGQVQGRMLERNSAGFKINHIRRVSITHWTKKNKPGFVINRDDEIGYEFLKK